MREPLKELQMIDICEFENFLMTFFGRSESGYGRCKPNSEIATEREGLYLIHDLGPAIADFLKARGVAIDWADRSRYEQAPTARAADRETKAQRPAHDAPKILNKFLQTDVA